MTRYLKLKVSGLIAIAVPIGFMLLFAGGEVFKGDISGYSHLLQIVPFVLVAILLWNRPLLGGWITLTGATAILIVNQLTLMPLPIILSIFMTIISAIIFMGSTKYEPVDKGKLAPHPG